MGVTGSAPDLDDKWWLEYFKSLFISTMKISVRRS